MEVRVILATPALSFSKICMVKMIFKPHYAHF